MHDEDIETIFIALLDEAVDVWRPVEAIRIEKSKYKITSVNSDPDDEHWQFVTGDIVLCEEKQFQGGSRGLIAVKKVQV
ncbi:MAG: hypothetical protein AABZ10_16080 [Nitrospirota bacterium]